MANVLMTIEPYWYQGTWVFDDESVGLDKEPFVRGIPEMIDDLVKDIPNAKYGFRLIFSSQSFPGFQRSISRVREEDEGWWYKLDDLEAEGWLCPAIFRYFEKAPATIYVRAEPGKGSHMSPELTALVDRVAKLEKAVENLSLENEYLRRETGLD